MIRKKIAYFVQQREIFCWSAPILPAYNFSDTMASTFSTYRLGAVVSLKFSAIAMPPISVKLRIVYKHHFPDVPRFAHCPLFLVLFLNLFKREPLVWRGLFSGQLPFPSPGLPLQAVKNGTPQNISLSPSTGGACSPRAPGRKPEGVATSRNGGPVWDELLSENSCFMAHFAH